MKEALLQTELSEEQEIINRFMDNAAAFIASLPIQLKPDLRHKFFPGVYIREIRLPQGAQLISKVHKTEHAFQLLQGRILVFDGIHEAVILKAPYTGRTIPGGQRIGIALDNVIWQNIHPTKIKPTNNSEESIDKAVKKIERKVVEPYKNLKLIHNINHKEIR